MKGNTLFAECKFYSEGKLSSREVAFLKKGDSIIEGYGAIEVVNNSFKSRDISDVYFTGNVILIFIKCN